MTFEIYSSNILEKEFQMKNLTYRSLLYAVQLKKFWVREKKINFLFYSRRRWGKMTYC